MTHHPAFEYGGDIIDPGAHRNRSAIVQDDDCIGLHLGNGLNQSSLLFGNVNIGAVVAFGFLEGRQSDIKQSHISRPGMRHSLVNHFLLERVIGWVAFGVGQFGLTSLGLQLLEWDCHLGRVDPRTATALEMGIFCRAANHGDMLLIPERKQAVVFEQNHPFGGNFPGQFVMRVHVEVSLIGSLFGFEHNVQDAADRFIKNGFIQFPGANRFHNLLYAPLLRTGHFKIKAGLERGHTVMYRSPIRDDQALEAPLVFENIGQQVVMFRAVHAVEFIVGTHHHPGFSLFNGFFKSGQVDFAQGAFIHFGADAEALEFLVVGGKVLDCGAHASALSAFDQASSHFPGQVGIFGVILEIATTKRGAFHVHAGTE